MKKKLLLAMIFLVVLLTPLMFIVDSESETGDRYRKIEIDNSGNAETLTDYQLFLNVSYDSDMQSDFDDLRFTWYDESSSQEVSIDYWLDKYVDSEYALVWVEVPSISGLGQETLYMYYGDPDATSGSNGEATFVFFDDFSADTTADYEVWYNLNGEIGWNPDGYLFVNASTRQAAGRCSNVHVRHKDALIDAREEKYWLETRAMAFGTGVLDYLGVTNPYKVDSAPDGGYFLSIYVYQGIRDVWPMNRSLLQSFWENDREWAVWDDIATAVKDQWFRIGLGTSPTGTAYGKVCDDDYDELLTLVHQTIHQDNEWWVDVIASRGLTDAWATLYAHFDYIRVRKFADPEPLYLIGPEEPIPATVDIDPDTLNLKSNGEWVTAYIELSEDYSVSDIDPNSILLNGIVSVDAEGPVAVGDHDLDNIPDLMVKFDRAAIIEWLDTNDYGEDTGKYYEINLTITGTVSGTQFAGTDQVRVLKRQTLFIALTSLFFLLEWRCPPQTPLFLYMLRNLTFSRSSC